MKKWLLLLALPLIISFQPRNASTGFIRINQLGYTTQSSKVAVWCSKDSVQVKNFQLIDATTKKIAYTASAGKAFGKYGPFKQTYRLNFSSFAKPGRYYLQAAGVKSPEFVIGDDVYKGAADFCLRYMRQQRSGFNPYLKDSCHTHDGYTMYGPMPDSTFIDVSGGWHDASDYLQYVTTSANATYHLLMAYRDFPSIFTDHHLKNGLEGKNGTADVLDEARWGLDWLAKMHPRHDWMFNQLGDDRDHMGMRIPKEDSFYGKGYERPVYFITGEEQGLGKYKNRTTGTSSTAGKIGSAIALGCEIFRKEDNDYQMRLWPKVSSALKFAERKAGVTQTAPMRAPYFYEEDNFHDDMELSIAAYASAAHERGAFPWHLIEGAFNHARQEQVTPWLGADTARHYQWYPFVNVGHAELARLLSDLRVRERDTAKYDGMKRQLMGWYKLGIDKVWAKARSNAFYRGVPFIWCSNNLTTSFATQCYWYRTISGDKSYSEFEQANIDWLFGCNPWGTSMVYGLPAWGDTPVDPHSAFTHLKNYPIDGGLVDGPVYTSIYSKLIGITLKDPDEYSDLQSDLAVYHDDYGDYSTNEPTMDGTASLVYLLAAKEAEVIKPIPANDIKKKLSWSRGGIIRGDSTKKQIALMFTGHEFADGGEYIADVLRKEGIRGSFFFTGDFFNDPDKEMIIERLHKEGHFIGNHSAKHLLYCDWTKRDSLLVTKQQFVMDLTGNAEVLRKLQNTSGRGTRLNYYFLPPYEWYNDSISRWTAQQGKQLINFTPGTISTADYTTPAMKNYRSSEEIYRSIINYEQTRPAGLNGFMLLLHIGTEPERTDKFYFKLAELIRYCKSKGYEFTLVEDMIEGK